MASVTLLIGRQSALRFRTDDEGQRIVEWFAVRSAKAVGSNGMAAQVEDEPILTLQLPMSPDAAEKWIKVVLPEFDFDLTCAAVRELTKGYVSPWQLTREQMSSILDDALESVEFNRQYMAILQRRGEDRKGEELSPDELEELSNLVGYEVESLTWEECMRRFRVEDQKSEGSR